MSDRLLTGALTRGFAWHCVKMVWLTDLRCRYHRNESKLPLKALADASDLLRKTAQLHQLLTRCARLWKRRWKHLVCLVKSKFPSSFSATTNSGKNSPILSGAAAPHHDASCIQTPLMICLKPVINMLDKYETQLRKLTLRMTKPNS